MISLRGVCFDAVSYHLPRPGRITVSGRMYLPLPMTTVIAAVWAAILAMAEGAGAPLPAEARWLLVSAIATGQHRPAGANDSGCPRT